MVAINVLWCLGGFVLCGIIGTIAIMNNLVIINERMNQFTNIITERLNQYNLVITERLNQFSNQNNTIIANLNNPAVSSLMASIQKNATQDAMDFTMMVSVLALFKGFQEGEINLNFSDLIDSFQDNFEFLASSEQDRNIWQVKFNNWMEENVSKDEDGEDDEA